MLHSTHQRHLTELIRSIKEQQIEEQQATIRSFEVSRASAEYRRDHYRGLADENINPLEDIQMTMTKVGILLKAGVAITKLIAAIGSALPNLQLGGSGVGGSPVVTATIGGENLAGAANAAGDALQIGADILASTGELIGKTAEYHREEWRLQEQVATREAEQIAHQVASAEARLKMCERELENHEVEVQQLKEVEAFHRDRFTSVELYGWMSARLSGLYFQGYRLAFDLAKAAERCLQYELAEPASVGWVGAGHWDGLRKGLLAGESLMLDLQRMEKAYLERNPRRLEIERTVSLREINPEALFLLQRDGACDFELSERLFDLDYPGHYCRQLVSISITIPAVVGPYRTVKATLAQTRSTTVLKNDADAVKWLLHVPGAAEPAGDSLRVDWRAHQQIAVSRGIDDSGLFELRFNDPRYLPFEGTGAVSNWRLRMPRAANAFDFDTITDVIVTVRYTAKSDDGAFRQEVQKALSETSGFAVLDLAQHYPPAWHAFTEGGPADEGRMAFRLPPSVVPPNVEAGAVIDGVFVLYEVADGESAAGGGLAVAVTPGGGSKLSYRLTAPRTLAGPLGAAPKVPADPTTAWVVEIADGKGRRGLKSLVLVLGWSGNLAWPEVGP